MNTIETIPTDEEILLILQITTYNNVGNINKITKQIVSGFYCSEENKRQSQYTTGNFRTSTYCILKDFGEDYEKYLVIGWYPLPE